MIETKEGGRVHLKCLLFSIVVQHIRAFYYREYQTSSSFTYTRDVNVSLSQIFMLLLLLWPKLVGRVVIGEVTIEALRPINKPAPRVYSWAHRNKHECQRFFAAY